MVQVVECQSSSSGPKCRYLIGKGQEIELVPEPETYIKDWPGAPFEKIKVEKVLKPSGA